MKTNKQIKAQKSFEFQCKKASKCRHEKYQVSCFGCSEYKTCDIQIKIEINRKNM